MTATNETTNYKLPLFTDNDQPTWLGDFNGAMSKIDTDMNTIGANASTALSAANNAGNRVATVEATMANVQTTANNAYSLAQTNEKDIGTLDGEVAELNQLKAKFPIHTADIAASAVTAEKLDATAIAAMWKSQRVYRFDSTDATADNAGLVVPSGAALGGFYLADLGLVIIINGYLSKTSAYNDVLTLPSYVPVAPRDITISLGCLHWTDSVHFRSWGAVIYRSGTRNLSFDYRIADDTTNTFGCLTFYVGTGTSDNTSAVAYANANGTFAL
ncbi:MAG: hypothetical protein J7E03_07030 [Escherichia coli]|nr:hypothetical protein [Escherichia coli]